MEKHIVVLGSINYDITASAVKLPAKGETVSGFSVDMFAGGKGANQAVQCAQMKINTTMIGQVGNDMQGKNVLAALQEKDVDCSCIYVSDTVRTGCASIYVDQNGDNMLVYAPAANHHITKEIIDAGKDAIAKADVFITQNEVNQDAALYGLQLAKDAGAVTILNPAPAMAIPDEIWPLVDYLTPNETESEYYTGILRSEMDIEEWKAKTAEWFTSRGVKNICITMGEKGSFYSDGKTFVDVPAFSIKPVDTTAAGDSFHGGFAYGLANGYDIATCMKIGNACGGLSATAMGAQASIQPKERVLAFLEENGITI